MKTLNLKIQGGLNLRPTVVVDGQIIKYKKNKNQTIDVVHKTENDVVDILISNTLEINGPLWWLIQPLFYIISLLGILNPRLEKTCYHISYHSKITLKDETTNLILKFNQTKDGTRAIESLGNANVDIEEIENKFSFDEQAKKRKRILKFLYAGCWLLTILIAFLIVIL